LIKADIVEKYLKFFNTALKSKPFERIYIDAFAGSGAFSYVDMPTNTLFGPPDESEYVHAGSAQRALCVDPPFDRIIFIEENKSNVSALQNLIKQSGHSRASVEHGDANELLRELCHPDYWRNRRGVIFLDPFGMNVEWSTLKRIAATRALDVWFLYALAGTVRNLPRLASKLDEGKRAAVTRVLGTDEWFDAFYGRHWESKSLFHTPTAPRRTASVNDIEAYVQKRLLTIFPHVEPPKRLRAPGNRSLFSLFFAVSNPSAVAINLARKGASHILKGV
jgi:three-Cys-motif partner protein